MKRMMTIALCAIMMALCTTNMLAQEQQKNDMPRKRFSREQMAEAQAKHIAKELALDDATSKKFIETYQEYLKEVWANSPHPRFHKGQPQGQPQEPQSEADAEKAIKERFEHQQKMLNLRETYYKKYSQFLTQKQIQRVYELEQQAMKRLHQRGGKHGGHHGFQRDGRPQRKQ